ncbi:HPr family phosphocarrier protein [Desmospora profundinema]|uniref:Phosphotransferase system HPr-like phosphotransfer protein n=1 Tax=Desmospora profundinema TaxID=1571184 RepID=A0ABU1INI2_9BACL|nr:HPr family phosphocarrier protein [Desmospora profundinema]MDR6226346.1 phosphotransferase system HPr-like phosphotransfer protein [Desmospora profundinema]
MKQGKMFITLPEHFLTGCFNQVLNLVAVNSRYESTILFQKNNEICDGKSLSGLTSFFSTVKSGEHIWLYTDGTDADKALKSIKKVLSGVTPIARTQIG